MKKRILAFALAAVLVISSAMSVFAATTDYVVDDVTIEAGFSAHTGELSLSGDFDVTYYFYNEGNIDGSAWNWYNYILEMTDGTYFIDVRSDAYGWMFTPDWSEFFATEYNFSEGTDWTTWLTAMTEGTLVEVHVVRSGNDFTITETAAGVSFVYNITPVNSMGNTVTVYLTGEQCKISNAFAVVTETNDITMVVDGERNASDGISITTTPDSAASTAVVTYEIDSASTDPDCITIDNGVITGVSKGTATVNATYTVTYNLAGTGEQTYTETVSFDVTVADPNSVTSVSLSSTSVDLAVSSSYAGTITVSPVLEGEKTSTKSPITDTVTYAYASSDEKVAAVEYSATTGAATITAVAEGTATITMTVTATDEEGNVNTFEASLTVKVTKIEESSGTEPISEATETDADATETNAAQKNPDTADFSTWSYALLLAGAAVAVVVIARKKVTE